MRAMLIISTFLLGGCAGIPVTGPQISGPAPDLMRPPRAFVDMKPGEDARVKLAEAAEIHAKEARRIKRLQTYVRTVRE